MDLIKKKKPRKSVSSKIFEISKTTAREMPLLTTKPLANIQKIVWILDCFIIVISHPPNPRHILYEMKGMQELIEKRS